MAESEGDSNDEGKKKKKLRRHANTINACEEQKVPCNN